MGEAEGQERGLLYRRISSGRWRPMRSSTTRRASSAATSITPRSTTISASATSIAATGSKAAPRSPNTTTGASKSSPGPTRCGVRHRWPRLRRGRPDTHPGRDRSPLSTSSTASAIAGAAVNWPGNQAWIDERYHRSSPFSSQSIAGAWHPREPGGRRCFETTGESRLLPAHPYQEVRSKAAYLGDYGVGRQQALTRNKIEIGFNPLML